MTLDLDVDIWSASAIHFRMRGGDSTQQDFAPSGATKSYLEKGRPMSLSKALLRLREEATRLNRIADEATRALGTVEEFLRRSNVGIPMAVDLGNGWHLTYSKVKDIFSLALDEAPGSEHGRFIPWPQASREDKIVAAAHLQELVDAILAEIERQTADTLNEQTVTEIARIAKAVDQLEEGK